MEEPKKKSVWAFIEQSTGRRIFVIPVTDDEAEKIGVVSEQIFKHLKAYTDFHKGDISLAIWTVENYLKMFIAKFPLDKPWIVKAADQAGVDFVKWNIEVKTYLRNKAILENKFPFAVKGISHGRS